MILYRIMVRTGDRGGMYMDATASLELTIREAKAIQAQEPDFTVTVEAEDWPTLSKFKSKWYQLTGQAAGYGTEFQKKYGHRHTSAKRVWPN